MGRRCAEAGRDVISKIVSGVDLVFVTAGLEGEPAQELLRLWQRKQGVQGPWLSQS